MYAESPRKLILTGQLDTPEIRSLTDYCNRLHQTGQMRILLDVASVSDCSEAGLYGLLALTNRGPGDVNVSVEGAHWAQFMSMLSRAPIADVRRLFDRVRQLIHPTGPPWHATNS